MTSKEISTYFNVTENRPTRDDLKRAIALVNEPKIAIDCGCGAGSDIAFLRANQFQVHAFDIEPEAIERCRRRFGRDSKVWLSQNTFDAFIYPKASLIVADSSLCFCPENMFDAVWEKITHSLLPGGIFVGSFVGGEDTMAGPNYKKALYWPDVLIASESDIINWLRDFRIESFVEHKSSGMGPDGVPQSWHRYAVIAQKA